MPAIAPPNLIERAFFWYAQPVADDSQTLKRKLNNPRFVSEIVRKMPCSKRAQLAAKVLADIEEDFTLKPIPME